MTKQPQLPFGKPIDPSSGQTLTEQIFRILLDEIHQGHWHVGDRLPSIAWLAKESGLSRWPIQQSFNRLREMGYIRQTRHTGSFLISMNPKGAPINGKIGVLMLAPHQTKNQWPLTSRDSSLKHIIAAAEQRNYRVDAKYLSESDDWSDINKPGRIFDGDIKGVISLHAYHHYGSNELEHGCVPCVYHGSNSDDCRPVVAGDTHYGFYLLTQNIIALGHQHIICFADPTESSQETQSRLSGHEKAMREAGMSVNREAFERSLLIPPNDVMALRGWLEHYDQATAVICMLKEVHRDIILMADMMGIRCPEDLSVVTHGNPLNHPLNSELKMTMLSYDHTEEIEECFYILERQMRTRRSSICRSLIRPFFIPGDTLAAPRRRKKAAKKKG